MVTDFRQLESLRGIGPNIRNRLERRFIGEGGRVASSVSQQQPGSSNGNTGQQQQASDDTGQQQQGLPTLPPDDERSTLKRVRKKNTTTKEYVPAFRSGPYAMLIALLLEGHKSDSRGYLLRQEIITQGQPYCTASLDEGTFSPIQGAIKTLTVKGFVEKYSLPPRFSLTPSGVELAERLWNTGERRSSAPPIETPIEDLDEAEMEKLTIGSVNNLSRFETFTLERDQFDIVLLVDVREMKSRSERDFLVNRLNDAGITSEQRVLEVGDFIWIARAKPGLSSPDEVVLDYVIERKREDDLLSSIPDGRFIEQKYRLRSSGIKNLIYLVEKSPTADFSSIGRDRFDAAIVHTQVVDGLYLRYTSGIEESLRFLIGITKQVEQKYLVSFNSKLLLML